MFESLYFKFLSIFIFLPAISIQDNNEIAKSLEWLVKFGYLEDIKNSNQAQALHSDKSIAEAIKTAQYFGGLTQTGKLDNDTVKLMKSERCGVADVLQQNNENIDFIPHFHHSNHRQHNHHQSSFHRRHKRYVIASKGWTKRFLTYFIENWSPKLSLENVSKELEKVFNIWSQYSQIKFTRTYTRDADINIGFYKGQHGDPFKFDGPGSVLAHAFYPNQWDLRSGDIHFDDDEDWIINPRPENNGIDFTFVALHEIGHSLGLSHSPEPGSVMNPYYKRSGYTLGQDDILALHDLYISKWPNSEPPTTTRRYYHHHHHHTHHYHPRTWPHFPRPRPTKPLSTTTSPSTTIPTTTIKSYETTTIKEKIDKEFNNSLPGCSGNFDTVANIRGELFIIKDTNVWRLAEIGIVLPGYPAGLYNFFHKLPRSVKHIDSIYQRRNDSNIIFFSGSEFWVFNGYDFIENSPKPLTAYGLPSYVKKIDAATVWSKNSLTYIFSDDRYWKFNETNNSIDVDYPKNIVNNWRIPANLDAAVNAPDGTLYFFKGNKHWAVDNKTYQFKPGYPKSVSEIWLNC